MAAAGGEMALIVSSVLIGIALACTASSLALAACGSDDEASGSNPDQVVVSAASSLNKAFTTYGEDFEGGDVKLDVSPDLLRRQVTLIGSWTFSSVGQMDCAGFIAERRIPLKKLITHRFKLDQAAEAYKLFDTQTTGKGVFLL